MINQGPRNRTFQGRQKNLFEFHASLIPTQKLFNNDPLLHPTTWKKIQRHTRIRHKEVPSRIPDRQRQFDQALEKKRQ